MKVVTHKDVGTGLSKTEYLSEEAHELLEDTVLVISEPPTGKLKVVNIYYDNDTDEQVIVS